MKRLMALVPLVQHGLAGVAGFQLVQQMHPGEEVGFPLFAAAFDSKAHQHRLHIGAGIKDIEQLLFGHRGHPVAFLVNDRDQPLGNQLRQRFAQRADAQLIPGGQQAHPQLLIRVIHPADNIVLQPAVAVDSRRLGNNGHGRAP